jgi:acyl carrier protein
MSTAASPPSHAIQLIKNREERNRMSTTITEDQIETLVVESLQTFGANPEDITREATFEALDIDSLDLAELSQIVHEQYGVELKGSDVAEVKTVDDAIKLIAERL